jgi:hypothetical protein
MSRNLLIILFVPDHENFPMGGTLAKYAFKHTEIAYLAVCHPGPLSSEGSGCAG